MKTFSNMLAVTAWIACSLLMTGGPASAQPVQGVRLVVDSVFESSGGNDQIYFVIAGGTSRGSFSLPVIGPASTFGFPVQLGATIPKIVLYEGFLAAGGEGFYTVVLRKHVGASFSTIAGEVSAAMASVGSSFTNPSTEWSAGIQFVSLISHDSDVTLAAWAFDVQMPSPLPSVSYNGSSLPANGGTTVSVLPIRSLTNYFPLGTSQFVINTGGFTGDFFQVTTHVETFGGHKLDSFNSSMCLDVPGSNLSDGVQLQQYPCNDGPNQHWVIFASGVPGQSPSMLVNVNSGKCVDIRGAAIPDDAVVQQFTCHGGTNQQFIQRAVSQEMVNPTGDYGVEPGIVFQNVNSGRCLDVANASTAPNALVYQFDCFFNPSHLNQIWFIGTGIL